LLPIEENLTANAPGAERGRFPVIFLKADVVLAEADADGFQATQVQFLDVAGSRLKDGLILKMFVESVWVLAIASIGGSTRWLDVSDAIGSGTEDAKERFRVHGAGANFGVVGLLEDAPLVPPEVHEF